MCCEINSQFLISQFKFLKLYTPLYHTPLLRAQMNIVILVFKYSVMTTRIIMKLLSCYNSLIHLYMIKHCKDISYEEIFEHPKFYPNRIFAE